MKIYTVQAGVTPVVSQANCAFLKYDNWNDYGFYTSFSLFFCDDNGHHHEIGMVKIGFIGQEETQKTLQRLPPSFDYLPDDFFSVGNRSSYYKKLYELPEMIRDDLLSSLRDIANEPSIINQVKKELVFKVSILRDFTTTTIRGEYARILQGKRKLDDFNFTFLRPASDSKAEVSLSFNVVVGSKPSTNIHALIGRNGSGKTTILNGMIDAVVGSSSECGPVFLESTIFHDPISSDYFSRLISVSFSAFDPFDSHEERSDPSQGTCYSYLGLKQTKAHDNVLKTPVSLRYEFTESLIICLRNDEKKKLWVSAIDKLGSDENFASMGLETLEADYLLLRKEHENLQEDEGEFVRIFCEKITPVLKLMSSGHSIVLLSITKLIAAMEQRTLVLLDEPEGHLHPPLLSAFIRTLNDLLLHRNGIAIIATHSPVVLQEIPKSCVWKLYRVDDALKAYRPASETFGENVGTLTREVFGLEVDLSGFHDLLAQSVLENENKSYEEILEIYNGQLGMEARLLLKSMVLNRDSKQANEET